MGSRNPETGRLIRELCAHGPPSQQNMDITLPQPPDERSVLQRIRRDATMLVMQLFTCIPDPAGQGFRKLKKEL